MFGCEKPCIRSQARKIRPIQVHDSQWARGREFAPPGNGQPQGASRSSRRTDMCRPLNSRSLSAATLTRSESNRASLGAPEAASSEIRAAQPRAASTHCSTRSFPRDRAALLQLVRTCRLLSSTQAIPGVSRPYVLRSGGLLRRRKQPHPRGERRWVFVRPVDRWDSRGTEAAPNHRRRPS
jgi:hypothetical protein